MKEIKDYEGLYSVTKHGEIYSHRSGKILKKHSNGYGYLIVALYKDKKRKSSYVHRLVAKCFVSNDDNKKCVNHINGDRTDNRVSNLEWVTQKENIHHAYKTGLSKGFGETHGMAKLTDKDVKEIKLLLSKKIGQKDIAEKFNVTKAMISYINTGKSWKHIK